MKSVSYSYGADGVALVVPLTDQDGQALPADGLTVTLRIQRSPVWEQAGTYDPITHVATFRLMATGALSQRNKAGWAAEVVIDYPNQEPRLRTPTESFRFIVN